jgi:hypothetical protein
MSRARRILWQSILRSFPLTRYLVSASPPDVSERSLATIPEKDLDYPKYGIVIFTTTTTGNNKTSLESVGGVHAVLRRRVAVQPR